MLISSSRRLFSALTTAGALAALLPTALPAQTLTISDTAGQSNFSGNVFGPPPPAVGGATAPINSDGSSGVPADAFGFNASDFNQFLSLTSISITLTIFGGNTEVGGTDRDALTLALDNIDTGLLLNGFGTNTQNTLTISGAPNNGAAILAALQADGLLNARIFDSNGTAVMGQNNLTVPALEEDEMTPIVATLAITGVVPEPSSVTLLAVGGLAAGGAWLRRRRTPPRAPGRGGQ